MREENGNALVKWLLGCAVVAIICVVILVVGGYFASQRLMKAGAEEMSSQVKTEYETLKSANKVPSEHAPVFDELVAVSQDPNASFWAMTLVMAAAIEPLQDGTITDEEAKVATTIRDFLKGNPDVTLVEFSKFFAEHPELQELMQRAQRMGSNPASSVTEPTAVPEPEEVAEPAEPVTAPTTAPATP